MAESILWWLVPYGFASSPKKSWPDTRRRSSLPLKSSGVDSYKVYYSQRLNTVQLTNLGSVDRSLTMTAENPHMELDPKYDNYDFPTTSPNKQSGHPGHTTPEQDAQVFQLRMMLEQAGYTERLDTLTLVCMHFLGSRGARPNTCSATVFTSQEVRCTALGEDVRFSRLPTCII